MNTTQKFCKVSYTGCQLKGFLYLHARVQKKEIAPLYLWYHLLLFHSKDKVSFSCFGSEKACFIWISASDSMKSNSHRRYESGEKSKRDASAGAPLNTSMSDRDRQGPCASKRSQVDLRLTSSNSPLQTPKVPEKASQGQERESRKIYLTSFCDNNPGI